jgi:hypothetical protein
VDAARPQVGQADPIVTPVPQCGQTMRAPRFRAAPAF